MCQKKQTPKEKKQPATPAPNTFVCPPTWHPFNQDHSGRTHGDHVRPLLGSSSLSEVNRCFLWLVFFFCWLGRGEFSRFFSMFFSQVLCFCFICLRFFAFCVMVLPGFVERWPCFESLNFYQQSLKQELQLPSRWAEMNGLMREQPMSLISRMNSHALLSVWTRLRSRPEREERPSRYCSDRNGEGQGHPSSKERGISLAMLLVLQSKPGPCGSCSHSISCSCSLVS